MHRYDSGDRPVTPAADQPPGTVQRTPFLAEFPKLFGIHVAGSLIDIDELGRGARLRDRLHRRDERVRNSHYHRSRLNSTCHQSEPQRVGPAAYARTVRCAAEFREGPFKLLHHWTANECAVLQRRSE